MSDNTNFVKEFTPMF
jgi:hypothetical protein